MDMNKAFYVKKEIHKPDWIVIDAKDQVLGRMATRIADTLRGKNKPYFTPHADAGDYVVIINADKIVLTGNKWEDKMYTRYSGYLGGQKTTAAKDMQKKHPTKIIELAVKRMLPKNKLSDRILKKLKVYVGDQHPHQAQIPK